MPAELETMLADPAFNIFYNAGTLIVIFAKPIGQHPDWDCCLAAQNLMLAAHGMHLAPARLVWPGPCSNRTRSNTNCGFRRTTQAYCRSSSVIRISRLRWSSATNPRSSAGDED